MYSNICSAFFLGIFLSVSLVYSEDNSSTTEEDSTQNTGLKHPQMMEEYMQGTNIYYSPVEHILSSMFMGSIAGGIIGGAIGFYGYDQDKPTPAERFETVYLTAGVVAGVGFLIGGVISVTEYFQKRPFKIGEPFLEYSMYSTFLGAVVGTLTGLLVYSSNNDTDSIINFAGYGSAVGFASGILLFFITKSFSADKYKFDLVYDPVIAGVRMAFHSKVSL